MTLFTSFFLQNTLKIIKLSTKRRGFQKGLWASGCLFPSKTDVEIQIPRLGKFQFFAEMQSNWSEVQEFLSLGFERLTLLSLLETP